MKYIKIVILVLAAALAGCSVAPPRTDYSLIDPQGVDMARYQADHAECAGLANQTDVADRAAGGAVFGALLGTVIGAAFCGRNCAGQVAAYGAGSGAGSGLVSGVREQQVALRACLAGRGYRVIR